MEAGQAGLDGAGAGEGCIAQWLLTQMHLRRTARGVHHWEDREHRMPCKGCFDLCGTPRGSFRRIVPLAHTLSHTAHRLCTCEETNTAPAGVRSRLVKLDSSLMQCSMTLAGWMRFDVEDWTRTAGCTRSRLARHQGGEPASRPEGMMQLAEQQRQ